MPQEPKKRHSRQRQGKRRASIVFSPDKGVVCANCKSIIPSHIVCKQCGFYDGRKIVKVKSKTTVKKLETA